MYFDFMWTVWVGRGWFVGGREKVFGFRNKNKMKVGFSLVYGDILGKIKGGSGLKGNDFNILVCITHALIVCCTLE